MRMCREDIVFWMQTMCFLFEPRPAIGPNGKEQSKIIPMVPWRHQIPVIQEIRKNLGFSDIGCLKSRAEGMSWIIVLMALHDFIFKPLSAVGLVSRNENAVDNPDDPDSMYWKFQSELDWMPNWMSGVKGVDYKRDLARHVFKSMRNGATVVGYAATADVASGGRKDWFGMDELAKFQKPADAEAMASTQYVTNSRFFVSTPKGAAGAFYELMNGPTSMVKLTMDWKDNEIKNRGLYRMVDGVPMAIEEGINPLPPEYNPPTEEVQDLFSRLRKRGYVLDGTVRSPWYDKECDRAGATPQNIAQELDMSFGGSMYMIFGNDFLDTAKESSCGATLEGQVSQDDPFSECYFDKTPRGQVKLWCNLDLQGNPPPDPYVFGCDISSGQGGVYTSNSVVVGFNMNTKEQVLEYATNIVKPDKFAELVVGLAKKFNNAYLAWEHMGPGTAFTRAILEDGYSNIYHRKTLANRKRNISKLVGWVANTESKEVLFAEIERAVRSREYVLRSSELVHECAQYARIMGKIDYIHRATQDDASAGAAHGDRVIALGVALQAAKDRPSEIVMGDMVDKMVLPGTMAYRFREWDTDQRKDRYARSQMEMAGMAGSIEAFSRDDESSYSFADDMAARAAW